MSTVTWLTAKNTAPATNAASRSSCARPSGRRNSWPVSRQYAPRAAAKVSVYCAMLNSTARQCLRRRRSSITSGTDCASTATPSGATNSSASAKVVEIVISSVRRPGRAMWMGSSSPTTSTATSSASSAGSSVLPVRR